MQAALTNIRSTSVNSFRVVAHLMAHRPLWVAGAALLGAAVGAAGWASSFYLQAVLDRRPNAGPLVILTVAFAVVIVLRAIAAVARRALQLGVVRRIESELADDYLRHALDIQQSAANRYTPAELLTRLRGLEHLRAALEDRLLGATFDTILLIGAAVILAQYSLFLMALAVVGTVLPALIVRLVRSSIQHSFETKEAGAARLAGTALDAFAGATDLLLHGAGEWMLARLRAAYGASQASRTRHLLKLSIIGNTTSLLSTITAIAILHVGAMYVHAGRLTAGELMFVYTMAGTMLGPLENLVISWLFFDEAAVALSRCAEVGKKPAQSAAIRPIALPAEGLSLRLEGVAFSYEPGCAVLTDINLDIPAGRTVAIVGESGAGKSTLLSLIAGLYAPDRGRILVCDREIASVPPSFIARYFGVVLQKPHLFNGTIAENIALGMPEAKPDEIRRAAKLACAHGFIRELKGGYGFILASDGARISAGQAQRLCLARALVRRPSVLLLDEATSNLDGVTEAAIWRALSRDRGLCTTILVTHRLRSSVAADEIVVLEEGRIVERGAFSELMERRGRYFTLWQRQMPLMENVA